MAKDKAYRAEREIEKARLSGATELDLSDQKLTELPESLGKLTQLRHLYLFTNQLRELPEFLGQLTQLQGLYLSGNQLRELPEWLGQLTQLQSLYLSRNQLTKLPESRSQLEQLQLLRLDGNQLTELPEWLGQLTQLQSLSLSGNQLRELPESLSQLTQLQSLSLSGNQLRELPESLSQLTQLQSLYLNGNELTELPESLAYLTKLQHLYLHNNPALGIPEDALGPNWQSVVKNEAQAKPPKEILDYYFATRGEAGVALREMKLIVVGWGKAGKTTLVKRLDRQAMDPTEPETHGIMIQPLVLHCSDGDLKARVWDFGGQHVLHAMHEFFLTARSLYLLVVEQRGDRAEAEAKYWLQLIRSYAPNAPVVVALNKSHCVERPLDKESLEKIYGPIIAWVPTECLPEADCPGADASIERLRTALTLAAEAPNMPEPRKRFPKKWVAIKDWLEKLDEEGKNYLDYEVFANECAQRGEPDPQKQAEVAALMHDLGVAMNYARDERLRDTTVLRPDWLANGIYAVLRANLFRPGKPLAPDAVLTAPKLSEIYSVAAQKPVEMLRSEDYPAEKCEFLLRLMNLFQLSFPLNEDGTEQLCPTLLGAEPPPQTDEPNDGDRVQLRYEFAVVPAPLLPRFIVRTFSLIAQKKLWQRGVILRYPGARARVWTTPEEKYLFATVAGPDGDRTELLSIIRGTLNELFNEYRNLQVTEQHWFDGQWVPRQTLEKFGVLELEWEERIGAKEERI
ncbi:MAG TPA: COR domain-containing protein [Pyrinomonadaceae bacterium]|nr:COR domain-containing protein [Pyrinomonadaceae bacterium]